jgi:hypothetical protein
MLEGSLSGCTTGGLWSSAQLHRVSYAYVNIYIFRQEREDKIVANSEQLLLWTLAIMLNFIAASY